MSSKKSLGIAAMILMITSGAALTVHATTAPITSGLAGWWRFNQPSGVVAYDSSGPYSGGVSNDGAVIGAASFATDAARGNVLNVYGVSGEVDYPVTADLQPVIGTISVWIKPTVAQNADIVRQDTDMLVRCNISANLYVYDLRIDSKGTPVAIIANDNPKTCAKDTQIAVSGPSNSVKLNQWTHLAMEWTGSTVSLFVNGKQAGSATYSADPTGLSYHGNFSTIVAKAIWNFNTGYLEYVGQVSDLRIYSRALSATEILNIATNGQ